MHDCAFLIRRILSMQVSTLSFSSEHVSPETWQKKAVKAFSFFGRNASVLDGKRMLQ